MYWKKMHNDLQESYFKGEQGAFDAEKRDA